MHIDVALDAEVALLKIAKQSSRAANVTQEFCQLLTITETRVLPLHFLKAWGGERGEQGRQIFL